MYLLLKYNVGDKGITIAWNFFPVDIFDFLNWLDHILFIFIS